MILKHPLGLGYSGYRWLQGSFQTGVYSVQHVHNEFLQLLLDVGWIPAGLFLWSLVRSLRAPQGGLCRKLLLAVLLLHCLLDFDTQFVAIAMILFLVMDTEPTASRPARRRWLFVSVLLFGSLASAWIGCATFFLYLRKPSTAAEIYPGYTTALASILPTVSSEDADEVADQILRLNDDAAIAHDVKARSAFHAGRLDEMVYHKQKAISLSQYNISEYQDYFDMLRLSYERCIQNDMQKDAGYCLHLIRQIPPSLDAVKARTSSLGWRIKDRPALALSADRLAWLDAHRTLSD